ncbi:MAG: CDP-diacylglycerol--glycerol-3-phosphate 3-phosphatidyltransferase, partial [Clostridia bacterium]
SMRLVISNDAGVVVAANTLAKIKTVTQFISVIAILLEPIAFPSGGFVSLILIVVMCIFTVWSGINYIKINWQYLNTSK